MKKILFLLLLVAGMQTFSGCALVHLYPTYRGTVLEEGTNKPIEGAGVLAGYDMKDHFPPEANTRYIGYQAALTDKEGKFKIPARLFFNLVPLAFFDSDVSLTIYKRGYGNFPGSFQVYGLFPGVSRATPAKQGRTEPLLSRDQFPSWTTVTIWLPKLETEAEIEEHDKVFSYDSQIVLDKKFPPNGMKRNQFLP